MLEYDDADYSCGDDIGMEHTIWTQDDSISYNDLGFNFDFAACQPRDLQLPDDVSDMLDDVLDLSSARCSDITNRMMTSESPVYEILQPVNKKTLCIVSNKDLTDWTRRHPTTWTSDDVYSWIMHIASNARSGIEFSIFRGENFHLDGQTLCAMSRDDFRSADAAYGDMLFCCLQDLLDNCSPYSSCSPLPELSLGLPSFTSTFYSRTGKLETDSCDSHVTEDDIKIFHQPPPAHEGYGVGINSRPIQLEVKFNSVVPEPVKLLSEMDALTAIEPQLLMSQTKKRSCHTTKVKVTSRPRYQQNEEENGCPHRICNKRGSESSIFTKISRHGSVSSTASSNPSSDLSDSEGVESDSSSQLRSPPRKPAKVPGQGFKGKHLWEFIRDLLHNSQYNPSVIRWEDRDEGIFRIVNSKEVARLWGSRKRNSDMTYEKLSRAMRFCRKAEHFENIPAGRQLPKKLCFKFGPKAEDWHCPPINTNPALHR